MAIYRDGLGGLPAGSQEQDYLLDGESAPVTTEEPWIKGIMLYVLDHPLTNSNTISITERFINKEVNAQYLPECFRECPWCHITGVNVQLV